MDIENFKNILGPLRVFENEPLSKYTYFKIGGPARIFFEAKNVDDLRLALKTAHEVKIPFVILGGGANVLVSDSGFDGLVIKNRHNRQARQRNQKRSGLVCFRNAYESTGPFYNRSGS